MMRLKAAIASLSMVALFAGVTPTPVDAQRQEGLVNVMIGDIDVNLQDIVRDVRVNVPIGVAAQIAATVCGVQVGVLASQAARFGQVRCQNEQATEFAQIIRN
jgi:hypothetical protein